MKDAKNLHVPLPPQLHEELREFATTLGKPATALAREAIERHLKRLRKEVVDATIAAWAVENAGTDVDLDPALESASLEFLANDA